MSPIVLGVLPLRFVSVLLEANLAQPVPFATSQLLSIRVLLGE